MIAPTTSTPPADPVQALFVRHLPRFRAHTHYALRHIACAHDREDLQAEALALAWRHFADLVRRGKAPETFVTVLALRCTQAVRAGRRLAGHEGGRDALSRTARARHGFAVRRIVEREAEIDQRPKAEREDADTLAVDARVPVPDQAAFRVDFPAWRAGLGRRDRAIADALARGDCATDVAVQFGLSKARVSQLREALEASWAAFHEPTKRRCTLRR